MKTRGRISSGRQDLVILRLTYVWGEGTGGERVIISHQTYFRSKLLQTMMPLLLLFMRRNGQKAVRLTTAYRPFLRFVGWTPYFMASWIDYCPLKIRSTKVNSIAAAGLLSLHSFLSNFTVTTKTVTKLEHLLENWNGREIIQWLIRKKRYLQSLQKIVFNFDLNYIIHRWFCTLFWDSQNKG